MMKALKYILLILFLSALCNAAAAQEEKKYIREGNKLYYEGKLPEAQNKYNEALGKNEKSPEALFNIGSVYFKKDSFAQAIKQFEAAATVTDDANTKAKAYYNIGNAQMQQQNFEDAANAYKKSLKYNPNDKDAKYNLAYALNKIKQEQQRKDQKQDQKEQNKDQEDKDQKQNQQGDNKKEDNKGQKNDNPKDPKEGKNGEEQDVEKSDSKEQKDKNIKPKEGQLSKEQAQRLLDALKNEEQKVQQRLQEKKAPQKQQTKTEKDW